jgi:hypothetical protein
MTITSRRALGTCVAAALLGAACSGGSAKQAAPPTNVTSTTSRSLVAFVDDGPLTAARVYSNGLTTLLPPPVGIEPGVTASQAYEARRGFPWKHEPAQPHLVLAKATIFDYGQAHNNGTVTPFVDNRLVWVVTFDNVPRSAIGGPGGPAPRRGVTTTTAPATAERSRGTVLVFVDAHTGAALDSEGFGGSSSTTPALACPAHQFDRVPPHQIAGTASTFIPGHPNSLLACRYHALNQPQPAGSLARSKRLAPDDFVGAVNAQPPIPKHQVRECGPDHGGSILLTFGYADGRRLSIAIDTSGCHTALNGDYAIDMEPRTLDLLNAYLGEDHQRFG